MMKKLLLVDGSNLLFQMFYGMPSRIINKEGKPIQGILGFVGALLKIIKAISPSHICILFDGEHENPRKAIQREYKANRPDFSTLPEEETPFSQLEGIYKALALLKIPFKELTDYEADDYIASYTALYQDEMQIVISSWDSDYFSLIHDNVTIYRYKGKKSYFCDEAYLRQKLHIQPKQYIFHKALVGDPSDHILGIPKIGIATASKIVNTYSTIQELYEKGCLEVYYKYLIGYKEQIEENYKLISFYKINSLPFSIDELICPSISMTTNQILKELLILN